MFGVGLLSVLRYDSSADSWSEVAPMPEVAYCAAACVAGTDVYVFSGMDNGQATNTVFRYDTVTDEWSKLAPKREARIWCQTCVLDNMVYVVGGFPPTIALVSSVCRLDPVAGSWSTVATMSRRRGRFGMCVLGGCMYAAGKRGREQTMGKYDPDTDSWSDVSPMLGGGRKTFCAQSVTTRAEIVEENVFDSLVAKAEAGRRG